jgi:hypothetical protein
MRYFIGCARSTDCSYWERVDTVFDSVKFGLLGSFDSEMIYFPAVIQVSDTNALLFYSGNYFGRDGIGVLDLKFK